MISVAMHVTAPRIVGDRTRPRTAACHDCRPPESRQRPATAQYCREPVFWHSRRAVPGMRARDILELRRGNVVNMNPKGAVTLRGQHGYREIADQLRQRISSGALLPGSRLPGEEALATEFEVARGTARAALQQIELDGLVRIVPGRGRFVAGERQTDGGSASYERVATHLRSLIKRDRRQAGAPLPSEKELCDELSVSRNTVRRAYGLLVDEGLVVRRQGVGAFVADVQG
jgi:DNA-binding GntR family transcriptional regulator